MKSLPYTEREQARAKRPPMHSVRPILNAALRAEGTWGSLSYCYWSLASSSSTTVISSRMPALSKTRRAPAALNSSGNG
jgi:hypothetical protein